MAKLLALLCLSVAFPWALTAEPIEKEELWNSKVARIAEADEIIVQKNWLTKIPAWNLPKRIAHGGKHYNERFTKPFSQEDASRLISLLMYDSASEPEGVHGCRGAFQVEFRKGEELLFGLGYAHGRFWAPISEGVEEQLLQYLSDLGFQTSEWVQREKELEAANQSVHSTPDSRSAPSGRE